MSLYDKKYQNNYYSIINNSYTKINSIVTQLVLGYSFQQLPLVLKPIGTVSYPHLSFEVIELFDPESFSEGVG